MDVITFIDTYPLFVPVIAGLSAIAALVAIATVVRLNMRISKLMLGRSGASLEESLMTLARRTKDIEEFRAEVEKYLKRAEIRMRTSLRGAGTVRFNPFKGDGSGGNQSFSTALISESGEGVVISTLYSRDRVSVFGKPLEKGASTYDLTEEEQAALALAKEAAAR
jgi:hypothetical protein